MKIAIVGAGPAGLAVASLLSSQHFETHIFERMANLSAQGSGVLIQPVGLQAAQHLNIRESLEEFGHRVCHIRGTNTHNNRTIISVDYNALSENCYAIGINRSVLWQLLYEKATANGAKLHTSVDIVALNYLNNRDVELTDTANNLYGPFDLIIDASGCKSKLKPYSVSPSNGKTLQYGSLWSRVVLPKNSEYLSTTMKLYSDNKNVGVGIMPLGRDFLSSKKYAALFFNLDWKKCPKWNKETFLKWKGNIASHYQMVAELLTQLESHEQLYLSKFYQHTLATPYGKKIIFIGDAAHSTSPQLGQGINMSLVDAVVLANLLLRHKRLELVMSEYHKLRKWHVLTYQTLASFLRVFYQSDNASAISIRNLFYPIFSKSPLISYMTAYTLSGQLGWPNIFNRHSG